MRNPDMVMWPIGTLNPDEAARVWQQKKQREEQESRDAAGEVERKRAEAKVIRSPQRKGPRTSIPDVETK